MPIDPVTVATVAATAAVIDAAVRRFLPNFKTLTEFGAYHGDCFWLAFLAAMHCVDPVAWPLTLEKLNAITADAIARGYADASLSGGININNADRYLTDHHIAHRTVGYEEFARTPIEDVHTVVKANAGIKPMIFEWANGGHFHGDEPGVHFHFSMLGGIDSAFKMLWNAVLYTGAYFFADGDDRSDRSTPTDPIPHPWAEVLYATPIAYIIIEEPIRQEQPPVWTKLPDGSAHDSLGHHVLSGLATKIFADNMQDSDGYTGEIFTPDAKAFNSFVALKNGTVDVWKGDHADHDGAAVVAYLQHKVETQQQPPTPPPAPPPDPETVVDQAVGHAFRATLNAAGVDVTTTSWHVGLGPNSKEK